MEKPRLVDQNRSAQADRLLAFVRGHAEVFARQGTLVAGWREYRGRRLGPYYRLAYREAGRQRSLYVGRSQGLIGLVRRLLERLQRPFRQSRLLGDLKVRARAALRGHKAVLRRHLAQWGIHLKGFEFRGLRRFAALYRAAIHAVPRLAARQALPGPHPPPPR